MNRKNRIKLDALSRIDDRILDRASAKRYRLLTRRRIQKVWIWAVAAAACLALIISGALLIPLLGKQVPVYRGMTVSSAPPTTQLTSGLPDTIDSRTLMTLSYTPTAAHAEASFLKTDNPNANENGQIEDKTEEILSSLQVTGAASALYYAQPNQDIYITIHVDNPDQYEIQSFTLNGKKYSSYMFEEGSDMENLVLKVNVGDAQGYVEYTIDAIKYIDGTEIKDVRFDGDRTVRVGVATDLQPTVTVSGKSLGFHSISFTATLTDPLSLLSASGGMAGAVLLDSADNLIDARMLSLGENTVVFDGLSTDTAYRVGIVLYYDDLLGDGGIELHVLRDETVTTPKILALSSPTLSSTALSFTPTWHESATNGSISAIELWQNGEKLCDLATDTTTVEGLYSNATYTLRVHFTSSAGDGAVEYEFTTPKKQQPTFSLPSPTVTPTSIDGTLTVRDDDSTLVAIQSILLKNGNTTVAEPGTAMAIQLTDLTPYTAYTLSVTYTYDLSDGAGVQTATAELSLHTIASLAVTSITKSLTGNNTYIVRLENPANVPITALSLNNTFVNIDAERSSPTMIFFTLNKNVGTDLVTLRVTSLVYSLAGKNYYETDVSDDASLELYIPQNLALTKVEIVDDAGTPVSYCFPSAPAHLQLTIRNPGNYPITSILIHLPDSSYSEESIFLDPTSVVRLEGDLYRVELPVGFSGKLILEKIQITYGNEHFSNSVTRASNPGGVAFPYCLFLSSDTVREIASADDLLAMQNDNGYYYYRQTRDIDLSGFNWIGPDFCGIYDGNGYKIKNMQHFGEYGLTDDGPTLDGEQIGLFGTVTGVVKNVTVFNAVLSVKTGSYTGGVCFGTLVGWGEGMLIMENCHLEGCSISLDARESTSAGITYCYDVYSGNQPSYYQIIDCTSNSDSKILYPNLS